MYRSWKAEDRDESKYLGTKLYQRVDIKLVIGHERPKMDTIPNTWASNAIKGWTLNYA